MSTVEKALVLLDHFSEKTPEIGLSELTRMTKLDKGTLHRYLTSLRDCGFLEQVPTTRAYRLGPAVIRLAAVREATVPLVTTTAMHLDKIAAETQELVHAGLPQPKGLSTLYAVDGGHRGTRVSFSASEFLPYHATSSGIAMLAFGPPELEAKVLKAKRTQYTDHTIIDGAEITRQIEAARVQGVAFTDQSYEAEVTSVAVPFFDNGPHAIGTIAVATPTSRMTAEMKDNATRAIILASINLSRNLGGRVPEQLASIWT